MQNIKQLFENRTSVRRYEREPIPVEDLETIYAAIRNTPTSYNGQQFSVIDISDQDLKEKLYAITTQKQIKTCNHFFIFCADYHKIEVIANKKNVEIPHFRDTVDGIMVGIIDASLAMGSALIAAQACGLGSCCVGYARTAHPNEIAQLLQLPKGVFVVCGLAVGVPREHPDVKPKQPQELIIHKNAYITQNMEQLLVDYDINVSQYNRNRSGDKTENDWCSHIVNYYRMAMAYNMRDYIVEQGCDVLK